MSRIGNRIITIPAGVTINVDGNTVTVKGPKGELSTKVNENITVKVEGETVVITRSNDNFKNFHGTANANIQNMIIGVTEGFEKKLESVGVGYRFALKGNQLVVTAGYSHPVNVDIPQGLTLESPSNTELTIKIQKMTDELNTLKNDNQNLNFEIQSLENKDRVYVIAQAANMNQTQDNIVSVIGE